MTEKQEIPVKLKDQGPIIASSDGESGAEVMLQKEIVDNPPLPEVGDVKLRVRRRAAMHSRPSTTVDVPGAQAAQTGTEQAVKSPVSPTANDSEEQTTECAHPGGYGEKLRRAREEKGYAVGDMVARLRISVKQLRALETETQEDLPESVYVRGFIRAYCRVLEMDSTELIEDYNNRYARPEEQILHQIPKIAYSSEEILVDQGPSHWWKIAGISIVAVAVVAGGVALWAQQSAGSKDEPAVEAVVQPVVTEKKAQPAAPKAVAKKEAPKAAEPKPAPVPVQPQRPKVEGVEFAADDGSVLPASNAAEVRIRIKAEQACWVRISHIGDDRTVFEQEIPPGSVRVVRAQKPLRLIFGNPNYTKININNTDFDFSEFISKSDGTARFRIH